MIFVKSAGGLYASQTDCFKWDELPASMPQKTDFAVYAIILLLCLINYHILFKYFELVCLKLLLINISSVGMHS